MRVQGFKTERVDVEVRPLEVVDALRDLWLRSQGRGYYIENGAWYRVGYGPGRRGSGDGIPATTAQIVTWEAFSTIMQVAGDHS